MPMKAPSRLDQTAPELVVSWKKGDDEGSGAIASPTTVPVHLVFDRSPVLARIRAKEQTAGRIHGEHAGPAGGRFSKGAVKRASRRTAGTRAGLADVHLDGLRRPAGVQGGGYERDVARLGGRFWPKRD